MAAVAKVEPILAPAEDQRFLLHDVSWKFYESFLAELGNRPNLRLTYDRGSLEIVTTSQPHEAFAYLIGMFITLLGMELKLRAKSGRTVTLFSKKLGRGLEADNCYWILHEAKVARRKDIDLERDPPPDLAVEVTITTSMVNRWSIYAALGVPEIWEFDGVALRCHLLTRSGKYRVSRHSLAFPDFQPADLVPFIEIGMDQDDTTAATAFVEWVRKRLVRKSGR